MLINGADYIDGTLMLRVPYCNEVGRFIDHFKVGEYEINKKSRPRTKSQNSYLWELCTKISAKTHRSVDDVYKSMIRDYGKSAIVAFEGPQMWKASTDFMEIWSRNGMAWWAEIYEVYEDKMELRVYYGSSAYTTEELNTLIQGIKQECDQLDIDVGEERFRELYG